MNQNEPILKKCRYCGEEIALVRTERGRMQPCEPGMIPFWWSPKGDEMFVTQAGEFTQGFRDGDPDELTDVGYVPHRCGRR